MIALFRSATWGGGGLQIQARRSCHGNWDIVLEIDDRLALLKYQTFLLYAGGGVGGGGRRGIAKLILQNVIWCLQVGSSEGRILLLSTKLG